MNLLHIQDHYINEDEDVVDDDDDVDIENINSKFDIPSFYYAWIEDLSKLVSSHLCKRNCKKYICDKCLKYFRIAEKLADHDENCKKFNVCRIVLPKSGQNFILFKNYNNKEKGLSIVYADCECLLKVVEQSSAENESKTEVFQKHEIFSIVYYLRCRYDVSFSSYHTFPDGEDPDELFP